VEAGKGAGMTVDDAPADGWLLLNGFRRVQKEWSCAAVAAGVGGLVAMAS
jgi:hypothetical protein